MGKKLTVRPDVNELTKIMSFVESELDAGKIKSKDRTKALLLVEENFVTLVDAYDGKGMLTISSVRKGQLVKFTLRCSGSEISRSDTTGIGVDFEAEDPAAEAVIRQMILNANAENYRLSYRHGVNTVTIISGQPSKSSVRNMLIAAAAAVIAGILLRFLPESFSGGIYSYILVPLKTVFMNALKMIVAPIVFFSIAASVSSFSDLKELGKTGSKIIAFYSFTTIVAIVLGIAVFKIADPGTLGQLQYETETAAVESVNIIDTLVGAVPDNFFGAFVNSDTLQLILLAVLFGLAANTLGKNSVKVTEFLNSGSELMTRVAEIITKGLPVMIFSSVASLIYTTDIATLGSIGELILYIVLCDLGMVAVYSILVLLMCKKNPFEFLAKAFPAWVNAMALSSSNAAMTTTIDVCDKRLGIDKSVYSFSIPLGATINMDGMSVGLTLTTLFFAKMCGMPLDASSILPLAFTVIVLSMGTPGIAGAGIFCISVILSQFGIPMECAVLFAAADALLDPLTTADNVLGDITGTYIVACRCNLVHNEENQKQGEKL